MEGVSLLLSEGTTVQQTGLPVPGWNASTGGPLDSAVQGTVKPRLLVAVLAGLLWWLFGSDNSLQGSSQLQRLVQALPMLPMLVCAQSAILAAALITPGGAATAVGAQGAGDSVRTSVAIMPAPLRVIMSLASPAVRSTISGVAAILQWARAVGQGIAVAVIVGAALESNREHIFAMSATFAQTMTTI